jgi:SAM-dependent methyltransferase
MLHGTKGIHMKVNLLSRKYLSRVEFIKEVCKGKRVLHLGCSAGEFLRDRVNRKSLFHLDLAEVASELYGVDIHEESLCTMRNELNINNLYQGDAEKLSNLEIDKTFECVVAGDLLEHLSCPGAMLDGVKTFLEPNGMLIISTNNAFGLHYQLRRWIGLGQYREHPEHVCYYSPETLQNLFMRHGYCITAMHGGYTEPPWTIVKKIQFAIGKLLFKRLPFLSGTLIVVAKVHQQIEQGSRF